MAENVGFVGRVMMNFECPNLRVINPREPLPNETAVAVARGGGEIIKNARICETFRESLDGFEHIYAATARPRFMQKETLTPKEFAEEVSLLDGNIAILFGPEATGLLNEEVAYAKKIVEIPANPQYSSLNLAFSGAIILYELFANRTPTKHNPRPLANVAELAVFLDLLESELEKRNFFHTPKQKEVMQNNIRTIFARQNLTPQELSTLFGIIKTLGN